MVGYMGAQHLLREPVMPAPINISVIHTQKFNRCILIDKIRSITVKCFMNKITVKVKEIFKK
jgi:hypothetical protein